MKISELRDRSVGDLAQLEDEVARDLWKTRFSNYTNQLDDTAKIRRLRRQIARIKTIVSQKNSGAEQPAAAKAAPPKAPKATAEAETAEEPAKTAATKRAAKPAAKAQG